MHPFSNMTRREVSEFTSSTNYFFSLSNSFFLLHFMRGNPVCVHRGKLRGENKFTHLLKSNQQVYNKIKYIYI